MISIDLKGAEVLLANSRKTRSRFTRTVYRSLKKSLRKPATERRRRTRGHRMIRAIARSPWGRRKGNKPTDRVKVIGPWVRDKTVGAGIGMYGYAAAARTGDRIVPHSISRGSVTIQHPGARVVPQISGDRDIREGPAILRQLERDVHQMLERTYGL